MLNSLKTQKQTEQMKQLTPLTWRNVLKNLRDRIKGGKNIADD